MWPQRSLALDYCCRLSAESRPGCSGLHPVGLENPQGQSQHSLPSCSNGEKPSPCAWSQTLLFQHCVEPGSSSTENSLRQGQPWSFILSLHSHCSHLNQFRGSCWTCTHLPISWAGPAAPSTHSCRVVPTLFQEFTLALVECHRIAVGTSPQPRWILRWRAVLLLLLK